MYSNELYHHGRLGQRKGVQNGPPYPLSRATVREAYYNRKIKKAQRVLEKEQKRRNKADTDESEKEEKKSKKFDSNEQLIREGSIEDLLKNRTKMSSKEVQEALQRNENLKKMYDLETDYYNKEFIKRSSVNEILRNKSNLTTEQLQDAVKRLDYTKNLNSYSKAEREKNWNSMKEVMSKVGDVKDWVRTGTDLWKNMEEAMRLMDKYKKQ